MIFLLEAFFYGGGHIDVISWYKNPRQYINNEEKISREPKRDNVESYLNLS